MYVIILMFLVLFLFAPNTHMLLECADVEKKSELAVSLTSHTAHTVSMVCACVLEYVAFLQRGQHRGSCTVKHLGP